MADYKQMYMKLMDATENAMDILIAAQRQCEEIYIETEDPSDGEDARGGTPKAKETAKAVSFPFLSEGRRGAA